MNVCVYIIKMVTFPSLIRFIIYCPIQHCVEVSLNRDPMSSCKAARGQMWIVLLTVPVNKPFMHHNTNVN